MPFRGVTPAVCAIVVSLSVGRADAVVVSVSAGGNLQAAIDAAQPGDTILLQAGATFTGNFVLPPKSGTGTITIRTAAPDSGLPGPTARIDPSNAWQLPKLRSPNGMPALATAPGAHDYTILLIEFLANFQGWGDIVTLGDATSAQNTLASVPHDLIVDRCYFHGDPTYGQKRALALNSAATIITNSYFAEIKAIGQDSQAIAGWNGPGPYIITNNYLEAAGENVIFGGGDPSIPNLIPSDITIRGNYLTKQLIWRTQPVWNVKNLFELKNAQRVIVDGNVMEYNWLAAQAGYAVVLTPRNQDGGCPWCVVQQVQLTNNVLRHIGSGIVILGSDNNYPSGTLNAVTIRNNLFDDVSGATWGGYGRFITVLDGGVNVTVDHNTVVQDGTSALYASGTAALGFVFTNNIVPDNSWAILGPSGSPGNATIAIYFPGSVFRNGVFAGANPAIYPANNYYPASLGAVGFVNFPGGNYRLASTSLYRGTATDGTDVGCNIDVLNAAALAPLPPSRRSTSTLAWRNYATGENKIWIMSWAAAAATTALPALTDVNWQLAGTGDFNGDGQDDIVFHNIATGATQVWTINGATMTRTLTLPLQADVNWQLAAVGDLNGDNQPDLVWRNLVTGENQVWFMNGAALTSTAAVTPQANVQWQIVGAADFNRDGRADLV